MIVFQPGGLALEYPTHAVASQSNGMTPAVAWAVLRPLPSILFSRGGQDLADLRSVELPTLADGRVACSAHCGTIES